MLPERILTAGELAERLGLSIHTIRAWCAEGRLPLYRLGRAVRFDSEEIERWLESQHAAPNGSA